MGGINEAPPNPSQLAGALRDGLESLSQGRQGTMTFQSYTRTVLPLDGFVFWTPTGIETEFRGSLHFSQEMLQNEEETQGYATVVFTSEKKIALFEAAPVNTLFIAKSDGFQFAFSAQQGRYAEAGPLWHYFGHSIPPALASQLVPRAQDLDVNQAVTSNSLALWLALNGYQSPFYDGFSNTGVPFTVAPPTLFPAFMVPTNETPPYGTIRIGEDDTRALQSAPTLDKNRSHDQLMADKVRIVLFGLQNNRCLDFLDTVLQYSRYTNNFGIMNVPAVRDAQRTQTELQTIAMKKVIDFEISYHQLRVATVARQLILSAQATFFIGKGA